MRRPRGKAFWAKGPASAKALGWEGGWCARGQKGGHCGRSSKGKMRQDQRGLAGCGEEFGLQVQWEVRRVVGKFEARE